MGFLRTFVRLLGVCSFVSGFASSAFAATPLGLRPCFLDGLAEEVRCGVFEVAEDAAHPDGRRLPIHFALVPATTRDVEPDPLVILAGGPGQAATGMARVLGLGFREVRRHRDILLVDLRGTGDSAPLRCPIAAGLELAARGGGLGFDAAACLEAQSADVRFYANEAAMRDLDALRQVLGYERWNLWGGSYGTRAALVYSRLYPERVRSVILDGAVPWGLRSPLSMPRYADAALATLFADCAAEPTCLETFPDPRAELEKLLTTLRPESMHVTVRDPGSDRPTAVEVSEDLVLAIVRGALYTPEIARLLPHAVAEAAAGRFEPLLALSVETSRWSVDTMALGVTLAVLCTEDVPRVTEAEARAAVVGYTLGQPEVEQWLEACRVWPRGPLPVRVEELLPLDVPALVLSGGLDPVTPPEAGEAMRAHFPNSWHLVAPKAGHNVSFVPCVPEVMAAFVSRASAHGLNLRCAEGHTRPPFFIPPRPEAAPRLLGGGR